MNTLLSLLTLAALSCTPAAHAGALVDISVIDRDTGSSLPMQASDGKLYVAGTPGHRYSVRIANRIGARVLAVLSVDGVNAVSGETANPEQTGYVLDAYQSTEVNGWRKSLSEVAQFNFTALDNSYAARTGRPNNVGVIGVAVFREKPLFWREGKIADAPLADRYAPAAKSSAAGAPAPAAAPAESAQAQAGGARDEPAQAAGNLPRADALAYAKQRRQPKSEESLGTGHGAREVSQVRYTNFDRASPQPNEVLSIWYDSYNNLVARGVISVPRPIAHEPQPFPQQFVPDPAS
ncbi:MAG: hypothetical protein ACREPT_06000, partial [Rudaea sp.]